MCTFTQFAHDLVPNIHIRLLNSISYRYRDERVNKSAMKRIICMITLLCVISTTACVNQTQATGTKETTAETTVESTTEATTEQTTEETTTEEEKPEVESVQETVSEAKYDYGVFLSVEKNINRLKDYKTVVIDAQQSDESCNLHVTAHCRQRDVNL